MTGQANFLQSLGWAVLNSLWQLALLWVIYQFIIGFFRNVSSAVKSSMASSLLIGGFAWFLYTFFTAFADLSDKTTIASGISANEEVNTYLQQVLPVASVLYLVLLILPLLHFVRNYRYVQVIRKYGLSKMNVEWRMFVNKVAAQMDIKKKVQVWVSEFVSSPVTIGFIKPVILVPMAAINNLSPQQLEAVLLHELSHIKRFDYLINLIINFIQSVLYFNPFVKAFVKIVEREREKSCDEMVLQFQYDSHEYASALLLLEKANNTHKHFVVAAGGKKNDLLHRVEVIMGIQKKPVLSFNKLAGLFAGLLCIIALNAVLVKKETAGVRAESAIADLSSPFSFVTGTPAATNDLPEPVAEYTAAGIIKNNAKPAADIVLRGSSTPSNDLPIQAIALKGLVQANYELANMDIPQLNKQQEDQVKEALQASKKVLESAQWKEVEKSIADVFTEQEKDEIRTDYQKQVNKFDWKKWENRLKAAYDKVDWEKINYQLDYAVNQVRLDSLQRVYNNTLLKLNTAERELTAQQITGIPDSDISLKAIEDKKHQAQQALNNLRGLRSKKIVHL